MFILVGNRTIGHMYSIRDLDQIIQKISGIKLNDKRSSIKILAIDDRVFAPKENLINNGYKQIETMSNIDKITDVEPFPIVLVDIRGIGSTLGGDEQGAHVAAQIKKLYPEKRVITFTAESITDDLAVKAKSVSDKFVKKGIPINEWCSMLDEQIEIVMNPLHPWELAKERLHENKVPTFQIAIAEHAYSLSIIKQSRLKDNIPSGLPISAKGIIDSLAASAIYEIVKYLVTK